MSEADARATHVIDDWAPAGLTNAQAVSSASALALVDLLIADIPGSRPHLHQNLLVHKATNDCEQHDNA